METSESDVARRIITLRGVRVMLDEDLARLYGVTTKRMNEQVRRNRFRFPHGFMFALTPKELEAMRSQIATSSRRNFLHPPLAFSEHGAIMLASVLNSPVAVEASVRVVRAFVRMREMLAAHALLQKKLDELEGRIDGHDSDLKELFETIRQLISPGDGPRKKIGFRA